MKVTSVPLHIVVAGAAEMDTLTGKIGLTTMVIGFEVAGLPDEQVIFEVSIHVIMSPFNNVPSV